MNLPTDFTHKADAHQQSLYFGHLSLPASHVRECLGFEITISQLRENVPRFWTRQVHRSQPTRNVCNVNVPARTGEPPLHPLLDEIQVPGGGRDEIVVVGQSRNSAVIEHDPGIVAEDRVAHATGTEI